MEIIPAIDIRKGKCVRLFQGDYNRETIYSDDPVSVAIRWENEGAKRLHIVDLDGAEIGKPQNINIVISIISKVNIPIQLGGGIRDFETAEKLIKLGIDRLILGTMAIEYPDFIADLTQKYREHIIISIDARDGYINTHGWLKETKIKSIDYIRNLEDIGVSRLLYTDISKDGTLSKPSFNSIEEIIKSTKIPIIIAGGISDISDIKHLSKLGAEAVIIGKALYTGAISLRKALSEVN